MTVLLLGFTTYDLKVPPHDHTCGPWSGDLGYHPFGRRAVATRWQRSTALNEMYMCDIFANSNARDKTYSARVATIYGQKPGNLAAMEEFNENVREAVKEDRIQLAKAAAIKRNARNREMRTLVIDRWHAEKASYDGNKSDFARHYSRLLLQKHAFEVEATTIATRWLRGL